jgi:hypothetical protein
LASNVNLPFIRLTSASHPRNFSATVTCTEAIIECEPLMSPAYLRPALDVLLQSLDYAVELDRDPWDFAVEIGALRRLGLSNSDLRWLLCKGWVHHATELSRPGAGGRSFTSVGQLVLNDLCCFVLTPTGELAIRGAGTAALPLQSPALVCPNEVAHSAGGAEVPLWDKDRRLLRYGDRIVKQFKVPAPNQEIVLVSFQEEDWSVRIDDPLPRVAAIDSKRRLHDTINSLNRNQRSAVIRFSGDGSGEGVRWEVVKTARPDGVAVAPSGRV